MLTSEVLDRAADEIERRGWGQGADTWSVDANLGLCIEGGIKAVIGRTDPASVIGQHLLQVCPAARAVHSYLGLAKHVGLYDWNDRAGRTAAEVIEVLRAAAMVERTREAAAVVEQVSA